jgi:hypothetical protein
MKMKQCELSSITSNFGEVLMSYFMCLLIALVLVACGDKDTKPGKASAPGESSKNEKAVCNEQGALYYFGECTEMTLASWGCNQSEVEDRISQYGFAEESEAMNAATQSIERIKEYAKTHEFDQCAEYMEDGDSLARLGVLLSKEVDGVDLRFEQFNPNDYDDDPEGSPSPTPSPTPEETPISKFTDEWEVGCKFNNVTRYEYMLFNLNADSSFQFTLKGYESETCDDAEPDYIRTVQGTYTRQGGAQFDFTVTASTLLENSAADIATFNSSSACGFNDWQVGVSHTTHNGSFCLWLTNDIPYKILIKIDGSSDEFMYVSKNAFSDEPFAAYWHTTSRHTEYADYDFTKKE